MPMASLGNGGPQDGTCKGETYGRVRCVGESARSGSERKTWKSRDFGYTQSPPQPPDTAFRKPTQTPPSWAFPQLQAPSLPETQVYMRCPNQVGVLEGRYWPTSGWSTQDIQDTAESE